MKGDWFAGFGMSMVIERALGPRVIVFARVLFCVISIVAFLTNPGRATRCSVAIRMQLQLAVVTPARESPWLRSRENREPGAEGSVMCCA